MSANAEPPTLDYAALVADAVATAPAFADLSGQDDLMQALDRAFKALTPESHERDHAIAQCFDSDD